MKLMVSLILTLQSIKNFVWNKNIESLVEHQATTCCLKLKIRLPCSLPWRHSFLSCILILPSLFILSLAALNWEMIIGGVEWLIAIHKRGNLRTGENQTFMAFSDVGIKVTSYLVLWREELCEFNNEVWGTFTAGKGRWIVCVHVYVVAYLKQHNVCCCCFYLWIHSKNWCIICLSCVIDSFFPIP